MTSTATRRTLQPAGVPQTFYPQGVEVSGAQRMVFVSGQVGTDGDGHWLEGVEAQTRQVIARISAVLAEAGLGLEDLVKITIYLTDPADYEPFLAVAGELIGQPQFTVTGLVVPFLSDPDQKVEIEAVAVA
jgi:enamine deaminase RidA (YjgF/YER057c/UK114 family)